jgi:hypothetical protein
MTCVYLELIKYVGTSDPYDLVYIALNDRKLLVW